MISNLTKYGAVTSKVRALYGKRLTASDYHTMAKMKTVPEVASYLKNHPGWADSLDELRLSDIGRGSLEAALKKQFLDEYSRIMKFIARDDRDMILLPVYRAELELIISTLRGIDNSYTVNLTPILNSYRSLSSLNLDAIAASRTVTDLLAAIHGSIYEPTLRHAITGRYANLTSLELLLQNTYYSHLFKTIEKKYGGRTKTLLSSSLAMEFDMLSLIRYLRLKRFFPDSNPAVISFNFPTTGRLTRDFISRLSHAPDYAAAFELVKTSVYKSVFSHENTAGIEEYYYRMVLSYNRKQLRAPEPTIYTPIAYLNLKEIELINISNIIESVRYGLDVESSPIQLIITS